MVPRPVREVVSGKAVVTAESEGASPAATVAAETEQARSDPNSVTFAAVDLILVLGSKRMDLMDLGQLAVGAHSSANACRSARREQRRGGVALPARARPQVGHSHFVNRDSVHITLSTGT